MKAGKLPTIAVLLLSFFILPNCVQAKYKYSGGSGEPNDPYQIGSATDLLTLAADTNDYDKHFILIADINLASPGPFTTAVIAHDTNNSDTDFQGVAFTGVFDGNSHTISNLTTDSNGAGNSYLGLFGYIGSGGEIKNLGIDDVNIIGEDDSGNLGGLAGWNGGNISNCYSAGSVSGGNSSGALGVLAGWNDGNISNCYSTGIVSGGNSSGALGVLVGLNFQGTISNCYSTGGVSGGDNSQNLGGLAGQNLNTIRNCYSSGAVTGGDNSGNLGGLTGINYGDVNNCYSTGAVTGGDSSDYLGGLVGDNYGTISSCYFLDTEPNNGFGTPLTDPNMKHQSSFVGWDFDTIWAITEGADYPKFIWQAGCIPSAPAGVSASDGTYTDKVRVTWSSVSGAASYEVWRNTSDSSGSASKLGDYTSPFDDSGVTAGTTYYYWVKAENGCGISDFSSSDSGYACAVPSAPAGVSASDGTYTDKVRVTWSSVSGATGYEVWRNTSDSSGSASKLGDYTSPFDDSGVTAGTTYYYWVKAENGCGTSDFSSSDSGYACAVPSAPTGVSASDGTYTDKVRVTWSSVSGATGYEVWRNTSDSSGSASKLGDYTSPFDDSGVTAGTTYYYWVKAENGCGTSDFSSSDSGYSCAVPSAPAGVSASDGTYTDKVRVTWSSVSGATGYEVWRSTSNSSGSASNLGDYTSPFDDSSVTVGTTYYYWVKAKNGCGTGDFSSSDSGYAYTSPPPCTVPSAPTGVSASDGTYTDKVRVTWSSVSGAASYEVWRNTSDSSGSASKLGDYTSPFDDSGVTAGTTYYYWVKAENGCGTSNFSSSDSGYAYSCAVPSAPAGVSTSDGTYTDKVRVTWSSVSGATGYEVWRSTSDSSGSASKLGDYTSPFDDSGVTVGTTYYYWVKAENSCGTSDFSSSDSGYAYTNPKSYSMSITKCTVTAGNKENSDKISFSGTMDANADDFNNGNTIKITIDSNDIVYSCDQNFPVNDKTFKNGKYSYSGTENGVRKSFTYDIKTGKFSFTANNVDLSGLDCPVTAKTDINDCNATAELDETIVNGPRVPIPILLMMGVKDVLRVNKCTVKQNNKKPNSDRLSVKGEFAVEDPDLSMVNRVSEDIVITLGAQRFTIPKNKLKAGKGKFTCSKADANEGGTAAATFNFNSCAFTLTIKNANIPAISGDVDFGVAFADFNEVEQVTLP